MPELPEVEIIKRIIEPQLAGQALLSVAVNNPQIIAYSNMPSLRVYGREGQACHNCGTAIKRVVIGGRSSCYCPACQK